MAESTPSDLKFTSREVTAWGGLAVLTRLFDWGRAAGHRAIVCIPGNASSSSACAGSSRRIGASHFASTARGPGFGGWYHQSEGIGQARRVLG